MELMHAMDGLRQLPPGTAMSIGNFDGVHRGHAGILRQAQKLADNPSAVAVVTFEPHPMTVLRPNQAPPRLTTIQTKRRLLEELGVAYLVELPPSPEVLGVAAEEFWHILRDQVRPRHLIEGNSFTFGQGGKGNITVLRQWAANSEINLHVIDPVEATLLDMHVVPISSSLIRWLIGNGRVRDACICLGRPYALEGRVVEGFGRGRTMNMPTANLSVVDQVIPMEGVYAAQCRLDQTIYPAAVSIGNLPTFENGAFQIEAHLVGFTGDLYGKSISIEFIDWLRDQRRFSGADALKDQMDRDVKRTTEVHDMLNAV